MPTKIDRHAQPRLSANELERLFEFYRNVAEELTKLPFERPPSGGPISDITIVVSGWLEPQTSGVLHLDDQTILSLRLRRHFSETHLQADGYHITHAALDYRSDRVGVPIYRVRIDWGLPGAGPGSFVC